MTYPFESPEFHDIDTPFGTMSVSISGTESEYDENPQPIHAFARVPIRERNDNEIPVVTINRVEYSSLDMRFTLTDDGWQLNPEWDSIRGTREDWMHGNRSYNDSGLSPSARDIARTAIAPLIIDWLTNHPDAVKAANERTARQTIRGLTEKRAKLIDELNALNDRIDRAEQVLQS